MKARFYRVQLPLGLMAMVLTALGTRAQAAGDSPLPKPRVDASKLPAPGSYKLLNIQLCPDGAVLTSNAQKLRLHQLLQQRVSLLTFMYTYCRDPLGCPLADKIMKELHGMMKADAQLATHAQLLSLSFDPTNDTPEQLKLYAGAYAAEKVPQWKFLTTASVPQLMPLLSGLGQEVTVEVDEKGHATRTLNHMLKMFLIDERMRVREIYSVNTASAQSIANDMKTLLMERGFIKG